MQSRIKNRPEIKNRARRVVVLNQFKFLLDQLCGIEPGSDRGDTIIDNIDKGRLAGITFLAFPKEKGIEDWQWQLSLQVDWETHDQENATITLDESQYGGDKVIWEGDGRDKETIAQILDFHVRDCKAHCQRRDLDICLLFTRASGVENLDGIKTRPLTPQEKEGLIPLYNGKVASLNELYLSVITTQEDWF